MELLLLLLALSLIEFKLRGQFGVRLGERLVFVLLLAVALL